MSESFVGKSEGYQEVCLDGYRQVDRLIDHIYHEVTVIHLLDPHDSWIDLNRVIIRGLMDGKQNFSRISVSFAYLFVFSMSKARQTGNRRGSKAMTAM